MSVAYPRRRAPQGPHIDWASFMPFVILGVGALVVLLIGLFGPSPASAWCRW